MATQNPSDHESPPDDETSLDGDSAFEPSMSDQSDDTSIASHIRNYRQENGRTYHAYGTAQYYGPNDEQAQDHYDVAHHFFTLVHDGKLLHTPVGKVHRVLDLGTGTGIWCIDFADEHPESEVKGIDLSPIQPNFVPPNCRFEVDDYNLEFLDDDKFDLIHGRDLNGSVLDGKVFYQQVYNALVPGGWFDGSEVLTDDYYSASHDDKAFMEIAPKTHPLYGNLKLLLEAGEKNGMDINMGPKVEGWLKAAGFVNIKVDKVKLPVGRWPKDKKQKEIGAWNLLRTLTGLDGYYLRPLTSTLGWTSQEAHAYIAGARSGLKESSWKLFYYLYLYSAQRPLDPPSPQDSLATAEQTPAAASQSPQSPQAPAAATEQLSTSTPQSPQ